MVRSSTPGPRDEPPGFAGTSRRPEACAGALILASGSPYRAELLRRLHVDFTAVAADVDERPRPGEDVASLVRRLADDKADAVAARRPHAWILGSDQVAALDGTVLGKPGTVERARAQLTACSGRRVKFFTAVSLLGDAQRLTALDVTTVRFRTLSRAEIDRYLVIEPALDCAGSFKCEGYGISLFDEIDTQDPTALIGLPLIATARLLRRAGFPLP